MYVKYEALTLQVTMQGIVHIVIGFQGKFTLGRENGRSLDRNRLAIYDFEVNF